MHKSSGWILSSYCELVTKDVHFGVQIMKLWHVNLFLDSDLLGKSFFRLFYDNFFFDWTQGWTFLSTLVTSFTQNPIVEKIAIRIDGKKPMCSLNSDGVSHLSKLKYL
jgi:hypothetical protein